MTDWPPITHWLHKAWVQVDTMTEHLMKLDELIPQLKFCGYECESGKLECNIAFRQIAHIIERLDFIYKNQQKEFPIEIYTQRELAIKEQLEAQMNFILTGCSDNVAKIQLEKMGYE